MTSNRTGKAGKEPQRSDDHQLVAYRLGDIAAVQQGYTFSRDYQGQSEGRWPFAKVGDLDAHGNIKYLDKTGNYVDDEVVTRIGAAPFAAGSIVFPRVGAALRNNNKRMLRAPCIVDDNVFVVTVTEPSVCDNEYLYYWFDFADLRRFCNDGTVPVINGRQLKSQMVPLPGVGTQRRTARLLATWDSAIGALEPLIAAKELHYEGFARRLFSGEASRLSCCYPRIGEIADRVLRQNDDGDHPLLTISAASGFVRQEERFNRYMAGESVKTYTLLRRGEFSYNKGNSKRYEFGCVFQLQGYAAALVPRVYVSFRLHDGVDAAYLRHLFAADYLRPQLRALVNTGVRNNGLLNIRPDDFMAVTVPLPSRETQARISVTLDAIRSEIDLLERQLEALREQKRGLMQRLLTGQWKLPGASDDSEKEGAW